MRICLRGRADLSTVDSSDPTVKRAYLALFQIACVCAYVIDRMQQSLKKSAATVENSGYRMLSHLAVTVK
jgi:hypothetical protein